MHTSSWVLANVQKGRSALVVALGALLIALMLFSGTVPALALNTYSASFTRSSSMYMTASDSPSLSVTGDLTVEAWVKFTSIPSYDSAEMVFAEKFHSCADKRSFIFSQRRDSGSQYLTFVVRPNGISSGSALANVAWTPSTGTWYHVAASYDEAAGAVTFFVNGVQQGSTQTGLPGEIDDNDSPLTIGGAGCDGGHFDGLIDEVRVWASERTAQEIADDKGRELNGNESNLVGYWKLNNDSGADASGNGNSVSEVNNPGESSDVPFTGFSAEALKVRKTANESVTSSTVLQNDNELKLSLAANKSYIIDGVIFASSTSATPDLKLGFFGQSGIIAAIGYQQGSNDGVLISSGEVSGTIDVPNGRTVIRIHGTITTAGTSGDLQLKWAHAVSNVAAVTVMQGSNLRAQEI
jgi:hypothetical protein